MKQKIIDLTHTLSSEIPSWDGDCGFNLHVESDYKDNIELPFRSQKIDMRAGMGTHMDAPAHRFSEAKTIDEIELKDLIVELIVIKVDTEAGENYLIMPSIVEKFEKENGKIPANSLVIFYTGWDKYWNMPDKYRSDFKFPSVHESAAQILVERDIAGLGIDTFSADTGKNGFPVHRTILGAGKYLVENVANAKDLPAKGAKAAVIPLKIKGGTESPIRLFAFV